MRKLGTIIAAAVIAVTGTSATAHAGLPGFYRNKLVHAPRTVVFKYEGTNDCAVHVSLNWQWRRRDGRAMPVHTYTWDLEAGYRVIRWSHQFSRRRYYLLDAYGYSSCFWHRYSARFITGPIPTPRKRIDCNTFTTGDGETWACWDGCPPPCVQG